MQITYSDVVNGTLVLIFFYLCMPPTWLLLRFLTPKVLVERYFKKPHFTSAELALFSHFPGSLMRTMIFMTACVQPYRGTKRQMTDVLNHAPRWYFVASRLFVFYLLASLH